MMCRTEILDCWAAELFGLGSEKTVILFMLMENIREMYFAGHRIMCCVFHDKVSFYNTPVESHKHVMQWMSSLFGD